MNGPEALVEVSADTQMPPLATQAESLADEDDRDDEADDEDDDSAEWLAVLPVAGRHPARESVSLRVLAARAHTRKLRPLEPELPPPRA